MYVGSNFRAVTLEDVKIFVNKNYMKMDREELEFSLDEVCPVGVTVLSISSIKDVLDKVYSKKEILKEIEKL